MNYSYTKHVNGISLFQTKKIRTNNYKAFVGKVEGGKERRHEINCKIYMLYR